MGGGKKLVPLGVGFLLAGRWANKDVAIEVNKGPEKGMQYWAETRA